jgi:AraC-like DNA-binding protein
MPFHMKIDPDPAEGVLLPVVREILLAYARAGRDPAAALDRAAIAPEGADGQPVAVSMAQLQVFAQAAMRDLDDQALGWCSRPVPWGTFRLLARASLTAPTVRVALRRWAEHHTLIVPDFAITLDDQDGTAAIVVHERAALPGPTVRELALASVVRSALGFACWIGDSIIPVTDASFPPPLPRLGITALLFDGRARAAEGPARLCFDRRYLDLPNLRGEADLRLLLDQGALYLTHLYSRDRLLVNRITTLLGDRLGVGDLSAPAIADLLGVSLRGLQRQLKAEGTSLQALKTEARKARALHLLAHTARPIKRIALDAGFSHEQGFFRAFREWTGETPLRYRRRVAGPSVR